MKIIRKIYPKEEWDKMQGNKKVNRASKALWNRCLRLNVTQISVPITKLITMGGNTHEDKFDDGLNTVQRVIQTYGTRKSYSEYEKWKEILSMTTKIDWRKRLKDIN